MKMIGGMIADIVNEVKGYALPEDKEERARYLKDFRADIPKNKKVIETKQKVLDLCSKFPLYKEL
jgi:hypothetical protein